MNPQTKLKIGRLLQQALKSKGFKQRSLARLINKDESLISRLAHGTAALDREVLASIDSVLGSNLVEALELESLRIDLFVSAPLTGLKNEDLPSASEKVQVVVDFLRSQGYVVHWPGEGIAHEDQLKAPDVATRENLTALLSSQALLYLQFDEVVHPTGSLIELGMALGMKIKTTVMIGKGLHRPFMLEEGFQAVAERSPDLPDAQVYSVLSPKAACTMIAATGRIFFGLPE